MNEGIHLYSICSIIAALGCMKEIYNEIGSRQVNFRIIKEKNRKLIKKVEGYIEILKKYVNENFINQKVNILKRNLKDDYMDISMLGAILPFNIFDVSDSVVKNTVEKINCVLRTYNSGYLRFENDTYMGGKNPWVIATLWMALYYIKAEQYEEALGCFKFVLETSCKHGFLAEQVGENFRWNIGLGWSHAMFLIVFDKLNEKGLL
jgi:GH15 family glucan-1,4-alpha-glucosidase